MTSSGRITKADKFQVDEWMTTFYDNTFEMHTGIRVHIINSNGPNITKQHLKNNITNFKVWYLSHFHKLGSYMTRGFHSSEKLYRVTFWTKASCT